MSVKYTVAFPPASGSLARAAGYRLVGKTTENGLLAPWSETNLEFGILPDGNGRHRLRGWTCEVYVGHMEGEDWLQHSSFVAADNVGI